MEHSSSYNRQYRQCKQNVENCDRNIRDLERIRNSLNNDYHDKQRNVNIQLNELREDLEKSVRHDSAFRRTQEACWENQEKATNADSCLNQAVAALDQELQELYRRKNQEEARRDQYYAMYEQQKEKERQEWLERMNPFG